MKFPEGFPTFHEADPIELLPDVVAMARERGQWLGVGLLPPRQGKDRLVRSILDRIPDGIHVHGWALRGYLHMPRLDSADSTEWFRTAWAVRKQLPWLTPAECTEIVIKRYRREVRAVESGRPKSARLGAPWLKSFEGR